jgi:hypothetical protein
VRARPAPELPRPGVLTAVPAAWHRGAPARAGAPPGSRPHTRARRHQAGEHGGVDAVPEEDDDHRRTGGSRDRVQSTVGLEQLGWVVGEDVAQDATTGRGHDGEHHGPDRGGAVGLGLDRAGDGEQAEADRIEDEHRAMEVTIDDVVRDEHDRCRDERDDEIPDVAEGDGWGVAQREVAEDPAAERGDERQRVTPTTSKPLRTASSAPDNANTNSPSSSKPRSTWANPSPTSEGSTICSTIWAATCTAAHYATGAAGSGVRQRGAGGALAVRLEVVGRPGRSRGCSSRPGACGGTAGGSPRRSTRGRRLPRRAIVISVVTSP